METDLTPDNSDLIALIESQLLGTELHVNGDENIAMADGLLDLELDTMPLSQSTRPDTVFRVPYKEMNDPQTSNSRLSSELCCKDQTRSSNNSTLLDTTRSSNHDDPPMEVVRDEEPNTTALPAILLKKTNWVTEDTEILIKQSRGDDNCTTCRLCQQQFTTHRRLRVHVLQHFITTFCPCGEYSYHRDYILRHQRTMGCHTGHLYDVDEPYFFAFLNIIQPCISDSSRYERLLQGFPSPRAITQGPCPAPPGYKKNSKPHLSLSAKTVPHPKTMPRVVLQRIEIPQARLSLSPSPPRPSRKRRWLSPSPTSRHSLGTRNLLEVEVRINELEREVQRLTPRITAAASELQALCKSVARLKRDSTLHDSTHCPGTCLCDNPQCRG